MAKTYLEPVKNLNAAEAFAKIDAFAESIGKDAKVRADGKGIYGSTNKTPFYAKSKESRIRRRKELQTQLNTIGQKCFGKGTLMEAAWTSHVNQMIKTGRLNTNVEFRGSDFQELVQGLRHAYEEAVSVGQVTPASTPAATNTSPTISVGKAIPFQNAKMADVNEPLPYTSQDAKDVVAWLESHPNDPIAARKTGLRTYEFYVDTHGDVGDSNNDVVAERANVGTALHYIGHSARVDTLRTDLQSADESAGKQVKQELDYHIDEYCDPYPMNSDFGAVARKHYLPRGGVSGQELATLLKSQIGD